MIRGLFKVTVCWVLYYFFYYCIIAHIKWALLMYEWRAFKLRLVFAFREYRMSWMMLENLRLVRENESMRKTPTSTARKQPKDPPKVVLHPKKPYVKWKRRKDYMQKEEEDKWCPSTFPPHNYAWQYQPRGKRDRATGERTTPAYEYPESKVLPQEFDREAHLRAVQAHEEAELVQQREAERRRRERAQQERNDRNNRNNRPEARLRCGAHPVDWPADAPDRVDSAKRTTEKERSLQRMREHQKQLEELENLRVAQLARMDELKRIGREIGGA